MNTLLCDDQTTLTLVEIFHNAILVEKAVCVIDPFPHISVLYRLNFAF
jgi:hypothetical protein